MRAREQLLTLKLKQILPGFKKVTAHAKSADGDRLVIRAKDVTFDQLQAVSALLGTTKIDIDGDSRVIEYSRDTKDTEKWVNIMCLGLTFKALDRRLNAK